MRVEWCRALARKDRWDEEVMLLEEEMRRVLRYLEWESEFWRGQGESRQDAEAGVAAGLRAYALKRAAHSERIGIHVRIKWATSQQRTLTQITTLDSIAGLEVETQ